MNPKTQRLIWTAVAFIMGGLAAVPQLAPYASAFTAVCGLLLGAVHVTKPGDAKP